MVLLHFQIKFYILLLANFVRSGSPGSSDRTELVFAPSGGEAAGAVEDVGGPRQANGLSLGSQTDGLVQEEQRHVVEQGRRVVLLVDHGVDHLAVLVREELVHGLRVPLAHADLQVLGILPVATNAVVMVMVSL